MSIRTVVALFFMICLAVTVIVALRHVGGTRLLRRREFLVALAVVALCGGLGVTWQEVALRVFAEEQGGKVRGMIANPVPNTTDHEYTARGLHYRFWSFLLPISITLAAIFLAALIGSGKMYAVDQGVALIGLWSWAVGVAGAVLLVALKRYTEAINLFI